jgi:four helix bundle suffix protein
VDGVDKAGKNGRFDRLTAGKVDKKKPEREKLIPKHGGYRRLKSYQIAQLIYDVTVRFCDRYIDRRSRTHDQMVQAARSGAQNIAEGSKASGTSKKTELKLTGVGRASLEELHLDYEAFLRQRKLRQWERDDPRRDNLIAQRPVTVEDVAGWIKKIYDDGRNKRGKMSTASTLSTKSTYPEIAANAALTLIDVDVTLLDHQLTSQAEVFEQEGGFTERLYRVRQQARKNNMAKEPTK